MPVHGSWPGIRGNAAGLRRWLTLATLAVLIIGAAVQPVALAASNAVRISGIRTEKAGRSAHLSFVLSGFAARRDSLDVLVARGRCGSSEALEFKQHGILGLATHGVSPGSFRSALAWKGKVPRSGYICAYLIAGGGRTLAHASRRYQTR